jgi:hypothetical protein
MTLQAMTLEAMTLEARRLKLRLPVKELSAACEVGQHACALALKGGSDPRSSTLTRIGAAIMAEELALLEHLAALHPERAGELLAGAGAASSSGSVRDAAQKATAGAAP